MRRHLDTLAVAGLVVAVANGVAFGLVLRARWFWRFFDSWEVPVFFMCSGLALGAACWWMSERVEGPYLGIAIAGVVVAAITSMVIFVLALVALVVMLVLFILENLDGKPKQSYSRKYGRKSRRKRR